MKNSYWWIGFFIAALPAMLFRDYTPDNELRYLSIANEALSDGHLFTFYNQGMPYADKPPLYLWIVMLGKVIFGQHYMWFLSLFSFIPAVTIVGVMDKWVGHQISDEYRRTARLMLMTSGLFFGLALTLRMDMLMCMFITLSLYTFYKLRKGWGNKKLNSWLFPIYLFLALFSKDPVGILVPLLSIFVFLAISGEFRTFGRYWGWKTWGVLLGLCALWFLAVYLEGGEPYLNNLLFHQTIDRAVDSFHHKEPFYYYGIAIWYSLAPWSLLIIGVIIFCTGKYVVTDLERMFITVSLTTLIMLSIISSKIAVYLAPAYAFFVYWAILILSRMKWSRWLAFTIAVPAFIFSCSLIAFIILVYTGELAMYSHWTMYIGVGFLMLSGILTLWFLYRFKHLNNALNSLAMGVFFTVFFAGWSFPAINSEIGFKDVCQKALELSQQADTNTFYTYGIRRPESMDVFLNQDVEKVEVDNILNNQYSKGVLIITNRRLRDSEALQSYISEKTTERVGNYILVVL